MNNEELKKKIVEVVLNSEITGIQIRAITGGCSMANNIADALIAAGIGDVETVQNISASATAIAVLEAAQAKHRAEVAELVVKNLNDIFTFDYQAVFEQAEKELEEERK